MIRVGIVGFGRMGVTHAAILNQHPDVDVVAITDASRFILTNLKKHSNIQGFSNVTDMVKKARLDAIVICSPTASHAEIGKIVISTGLHVFMEKPLATTHAEAKALVEAARSKRIVNQVGYFLRLNEILSAVQGHIKNGLIGNVVHYTTEMYGGTVIRPWKSGWRGKRSKGGGCALDYASHAIDLSQFLFGDVDQVGGSAMPSIFSTDVEDGVYSTLYHTSGVTGQLSVSWSDETYRRPYNKLHIMGTQGKIIADRQEYHLYLKNSHGEFTKGWNTRSLTHVQEGRFYELRGSEYTNQLDHFIRCISGEIDRPICTFEDASKTDRVVDLIFSDCQSRSSVAETNNAA